MSFKATHQIIHMDDVFEVMEIGEWHYQTREGESFKYENGSWHYKGKPLTGIRVSCIKERVSTIPRYQKIARIIGCIDRCKTRAEKDGSVWVNRWEESLEKEMESAPSGSGWDCGTKLDDSSTPEWLGFYGSFHHMDESGGYDGWTEHRILVKPSLEMGMTLRVTGRDRNGIKEYLGEMFHDWLTESVAEYS